MTYRLLLYAAVARPYIKGRKRSDFSEQSPPPHPQENLLHPLSPLLLLTFDGELAGDDIPEDFAGDVAGVFLGEPLGDVVEGSPSFPTRDGGGKSVHEGALGSPTAPPTAIDP